MVWWMCGCVWMCVQDLEGVEWLKQYLSSSAVSAEMTVLVTSHDRDFLDNVCTDIIRFAHQQLHYYPGESECGELIKLEFVVPAEWCVHYAHLQQIDHLQLTTMSLLLQSLLHNNISPGNYTDYEKARSDKNLSNTRSQDLINKERKHIEETIRRLQVTASRDTSGKGSGMVASRKKKLARHGAEKDENGHKFKVQVGAITHNTAYVLICCII